MNSNSMDPHQCAICFDELDNAQGPLCKESIEVPMASWAANFVIGNNNHNMAHENHMDDLIWDGGEFEFDW